MKDTTQEYERSFSHNGEDYKAVLEDPVGYPDKLMIMSRAAHYHTKDWQIDYILEKRKDGSSFYEYDDSPQLNGERKIELPKEGEMFEVARAKYIELIDLWARQIQGYTVSARDYADKKKQRVNQ